MKDINMQHMTMTEYVSIAILSELAMRDDVWDNIVAGEVSAKDVAEQSFYWADVWMKVREERNRGKA